MTVAFGNENKSPNVSRCRIVFCKRRFLRRLTKSMNSQSGITCQPESNCKNGNKKNGNKVRVRGIEYQKTKGSNCALLRMMKMQGSIVLAARGRTPNRVSLSAIFTFDVSLASVEVANLKVCRALDTRFGGVTLSGSTSGIHHVLPLKRRRTLCQTASPLLSSPLSLLNSTLFCLFVFALRGFPIRV